MRSSNPTPLQAHPEHSSCTSKDACGHNARFTTLRCCAVVIDAPKCKGDEVLPSALSQAHTQQKERKENTTPLGDSIKNSLICNQATLYPHTTQQLLDVGKRMQKPQQTSRPAWPCKPSCQGVALGSATLATGPPRMLLLAALSLQVQDCQYRSDHTWHRPY